MGALPAVHRQLPFGCRDPRLLLRHQAAQLAGHAQGVLFRHARRPCRREDGQDHVWRRLPVRPALGAGNCAGPAQRAGQRHARTAGESRQGAAGPGRQG